jgi:hypothetical protein
MEKGKNKYCDPDMVPLIIHENVLIAYLNYNGDPAEFQRMMREGKDGHNDEYDEYMRQIAEDRTIAQAMLGWKYLK